MGAKMKYNFRACCWILINICKLIHIKQGSANSRKVPTLCKQHLMVDKMLRQVSKKESRQQQLLHNPRLLIQREARRVVWVSKDSKISQLKLNHQVFLTEIRIILQLTRVLPKELLEVLKAGLIKLNCWSNSISQSKTLRKSKKSSP